jgi:HAD superfamily hydrolase (TIGR01549 family)
MIRHVLFDLDGTLIDTVDFHAWSWERTFRQFGKEVRFQAIREQIGKGSDQLLPVFWSEEELERLGDELRKYRGALFRREYLPRVKAFPGVRELFERIRGDGKRIAVASSSTKDELDEFLQIARVADLADVTISADDADRSKPYPDIFEAALRELGRPNPREAIVIGDTPYDAQAASAAGLETIALLCGGFPEEELRASGCIAIYRDPADLLERYQESPLSGAARARTNAE